MVHEQRDEFDALPFGEIPRLARLQELLAQLLEQGVGVIAGKYVRRSLAIPPLNLFHYARLPKFTPIPDTGFSIKDDFVLRLHLVPTEKQGDDIQIDPGKSVDDLIKEARLDFEEGQRSAMAHRKADDDEIPF